MGADSFSMNLGKIRHQMAKDRRHSANNLRRATNKLYNTLAKNAEMQRRANKKQMANTRRAKLDAMDALRGAKASFARRLARMHAVAVRSAKKQQHKINKLTGVVTANAIKSAKGRAMLKSMQSANKKNKAALSAKVSTMISSLRKSTSKSIYALDMENKAGRAELKKEILYAVRAAAKDAKKNLKKSVQWANGRF